MSAATTVNLVINQKASFEVTFNVLNSNSAPLNLTGYVANAAFKTDITAPDTSAVAFQTSFANASNGSVTIALTPTQTSAMQVGRYVYDVSITNTATSFKTRIVEGRITVSGGVA
jgi:LEA14-like dessication related protein